MPPVIPQDAVSDWYMPEDSEQWTSLLDGLDIGAPSFLHLLQEDSGNPEDSIGGVTLTAASWASYQQTLATWNRYACTATDGLAASLASTSASLPDQSANSMTTLVFFARRGTPASTRPVFMHGAAAFASIISCEIGADNFLRCNSRNASVVSGTVDYGVDVVVPIFLQHDRTNGIHRVVTPQEVITATYAALGSNKGLGLGAAAYGQCPPGAWLYSVTWTGADAEMSLDQMRELFSRMQQGAPTTRAAFSRGSTRMQWVLCIDGYDKILTDGDTDAALAAHAGTDWTQALGGLVVECRPEQVGDPNNPFANTGGRCVVYVHDDRDQTFGIETHRRGAGSWTTLRGTIDRNDTALTISSNAGFDASGEAHIGTECLQFSGTTSSTMTASIRGKYTAVGCHSSGSGGSRFAEHHRVSLNQHMVQSNPIISEQPRRWIGRRANLYLHIVDENGNLNSKANAELVFPGRIEALGDDPNTACTVLKLKHLLSEVGPTIIGGNRFSATATEGVYLKAGTRVKMFEIEKSTVTKIANDLVVVASGASGTNQINAGHYTLNEICQFMNNWLGGETVAARVEGRYSWISPVETGDGYRTVLDWNIVRATSENVAPQFDLPNVIAGMLGLAPTEGVQFGGFTRWGPGKMHRPNTQQRGVGEHVPMKTAVFSKGGPGGSLPSFRMLLENERGEFVNQYETLPSIIKSGLDSSKQWGLFLVDEKLLIQANYTSNELRDCFITPLGQQQINDNQEPFYTLGRRADEDAGPVTVRQVFDIEGSFFQVMMLLHYNTGTDNYNHADYDTAAHGLGAGIPGGYLGDVFERSVDALPRADALCRIRFDEPKQLSEIIGGELLARGAFLVWKNGALMYQQWQSPTASLATLTLDETNKFVPSGSDENSKAATLETGAYARPHIKLDYNPDFAFGRETRYRASQRLIDHVAIDDGANDGQAMTIKLAGTANNDDAEALAADVLAKMPLRSRPSKFAVRSIGSRQFFGVAPGDIAVITDRYARDPLTGQRYNAATDTGGLDERPCTIMRHTFDLGGPQPGRGQDKARGFTGEVEVNFFDQNRCVPFSPAADVDETMSSGGFSAGYNNGTLQLLCKAHVYSESSEAVDASRIPVGGEITITEKDPSNTAAPLTWTVTVSQRSGNYLTIDAALGGWDSGKTYRITSALFSQSTAVQKDYAYQADDADEYIENVDVPYLYGSTGEEASWSINTTEATEFIVDQCYSEGRPLDSGNEKALINAVNNLVDFKTAHHALYMWSVFYTDASLDTWYMLHFGRIHLGRETLNNSVFRYVSLAPWLWLDNSNGATTGYVRVTLSRQMPRQRENSTSSDEIEFGDYYHQVTWSTTSTTPVAGSLETFPAILKAQDWGMAYILVETKDAYCRGLIRGKEGERVLVL
jgi:hypothetical protein